MYGYYQSDFVPYRTGDLIQENDQKEYRAGHNKGAGDSSYYIGIIVLNNYVENLGTCDIQENRKVISRVN